MAEAQIQVEWAADAATLADAIGDQRLFRIYATRLGMPDHSRTRMTLAGSDAEMVVHRLMLVVSNDRRRVDMVLAAQAFETAAGGADFTLGAFSRAEWNCHAWVDAGQAGMSAPEARPPSRA